MKRASEETKTTAFKKQAGLDLLDSVLSSDSALFPQVTSFLHWKDAVALGSVDKERNKAYSTHQEAILQPLLESLENLCQSNIHNYCGKAYAPASQRVCTCGDIQELEHPDFHPANQDLARLDPRYRISYDTLPMNRKVAEMIHFLGTLVRNMRPHLNFADPANFRNMPYLIGDIGGWSMGISIHANGLLRHYPCRAALAFNVALASFAEGAMTQGDDHYFNEAFLGHGGIDPSGSCFGTTICYQIEQMIPLSDEAIVNFLCQNVLPSDETLNMLGPGLAERVLLCAPFLKWINNDNKIVLPAGLERFDANMAQDVMMIAVCFGHGNY